MYILSHDISLFPEDNNYETLNFTEQEHLAIMLEYPQHMVQMAFASKKLTYDFASPNPYENLCRLCHCTGHHDSIAQ